MLQPPDTFPTDFALNVAIHLLSLYWQELHTIGRVTHRVMAQQNRQPKNRPDGQAPIPTPELGITISNKADHGLEDMETDNPKDVIRTDEPSSKWVLIKLWFLLGNSTYDRDLIIAELRSQLEEFVYQCHIWTHVL